MTTVCALSPGMSGRTGCHEKQAPVRGRANYHVRIGEGFIRLGGGQKRKTNLMALRSIHHTACSPRCQITMEIAVGCVFSSSRDFSVSPCNNVFSICQCHLSSAVERGLVCVAEDSVTVAEASVSVCKVIRRRCLFRGVLLLYLTASILT